MVAQAFNPNTGVAQTRESLVSSRLAVLKIKKGRKRPGHSYSTFLPERPPPKQTSVTQNTRDFDKEIERSRAAQV